VPIEVRHGPSPGMEALAGLMGGVGRAAISETEARRIGGRQIAAQEAQAARQREQIEAQQAAQAAQLAAQRAAQIRQIEAQADRQKEAADTAYARTALAAGLQEKIQEQQFDNQMAKMQEAARLQAQQWDYQYTAKQRQEIARLNETDQLVETNPEYADIRDQWRIISLQKRAGITPRAIPANPNKPVYPEGVGPGILTKEPDGSTTTIDQYGQKKLIQRYDQSPEYLEKKLQMELEARKVELQRKHEAERLKQEIKWAGEKVPIMQEAEEGGFLGWGAQEAGQIGERYRTPEEVKTLSEYFFGPRPPTNAELEEELRRRVEARKQAGNSIEIQKQVEDSNWAERYEAGGIKVTEADRRLPSKAGKAQAYIRHMIPGKYRSTEEMPPEVHQAFMEASRILQNYYQAVAEQER